MLAVDGDTFYIRGVTYGTFRPDAAGEPFPTPARVEHDFAQMAAQGLNALRTYTVPPRWLLDAAQRHGLRVMVGLPWEQHIAFLDDPARVRSIEERVREGVRACADHPAVLCYAIGNEIPASIVRWHGPRRVERFLLRLYRAAKAEDPAGLVTYVNFPSTEYLHLPFLDLVCFNVYLETPEALDRYLARLQNLAGDRPLLLAEIGLDSRRNGEVAQAASLAWQVRAAFAAGCAGAFVFAWTDEWHRGGFDIEDWDFGLTDRDRRPKPALASVRAAFAEVPFPAEGPWPRISVVICSYNGARTLRETFAGVGRIDYPDFEVILVDDGSRDGTPQLGREFGARVISTPNRGLSSARNTGLEAATGEIVAYLDDDAVPERYWLRYLAHTFRTEEVVAVGAPNLAPPGDGKVAHCVANAPGGPTHVLLSDREAEHLPGCNLAVRRREALAIGGFDPRFRVAGDDVDFCWRLQERGWRLGFHPAAVVWHHRRGTVRGYWRQQRGYGRAEALLERKWPQKYTVAGQPVWGGRVYGRGLTPPLPHFRRVHFGTWGSALFQSVYEPAPGLWRSLPLMPEWYLLVIALLGVSLAGLAWRPLLLALPLLLLAVGAVATQATLGALRASFTTPGLAPRQRRAMRALTGFLHVLQPLARLAGRLDLGLAPWRLRGAGLAIPVARELTIWSERWHAPDAWPASLEATLRQVGAYVRRGGPFDRWDLEVRGGPLGMARMLLAVEEHGGGKQLARLRVEPCLSSAGRFLCAFLLILVLGLLWADDAVDFAILALILLVLLLRAALEAGAAMDAVDSALARPLPVPQRALPGEGTAG